MNDVFVQSNESDANRLFAFARNDDGSLDPIGAFATGGRGDGVAHLTSQGSVVVTGDGRHVLVANAGSGDVSVFANGDSPALIAATPAGAAPKSIAERDGLVFVLNTGEPSIAAFRLVGGALRAIDDGRRALPPGSDPAQVGFTPDGKTLVVTQRGDDAVALYPIDADGRLGDPRVVESAGPTPYGFTFASGTLVVTEAFRAEKGKAAASSYAIRAGDAAPVTRSVGNGRSEICWAVAANGGRHVFTTNFADGAVSRYAVADDGSLALEDAVAGVTEDGRPGLRDEDVSSDGRYLYAIDADAGAVFGWSIDERGVLSALGMWNGMPATIAGLAAR